MKGKVLSKVIALTLSAAMLISGSAAAYGASGQATEQETTAETGNEAAVPADALTKVAPVKASAAKAATEDYELIIEDGVVTSISVIN